ncbi:MAG: FAD synthetase family protein [Spirochaetales bacterium]|nr:MAG: FAD synthetase family protein [Spirochaetales bacterium]
MKIFSWDDLTAGHVHLPQAAGISIGVFDGVHRGHQMLINHVGAKPELLPGIVTFSSNPSKFFHPHNYLGDIFTLEQKLKVFRSFGLAFILLIDFSEEFSALSGEEFIYYVIKYVDIRYIALGGNFHCGKNASTSAYMIRTILSTKGIDVDIFDPFTLGGVPVSSTEIRKAVYAGNTAAAGEMLGRNYEVVLNPGVYEMDGEWAIAGRPVFQQVLPKTGEYRIALTSQNEELHSTLSCREEDIVWKQPENRRFEKFIFM